MILYYCCRDLKKLSRDPCLRLAGRDAVGEGEGGDFAVVAVLLPVVVAVSWLGEEER